MKVFIAGITGTIGWPVALAFIRNGWTVYGLVRSEDKAKQVAKEEIHPVVSTVQNVDGWKNSAAKCDVLIDLLVDYQDPSAGKIIQTQFFALLEKDPSKTIIFTSGVWTVGNSDTVLTESDHNPPLKMVAGRLAVEQEYIKKGAIVIRPALVYGRAGSLTAQWFKTSESGKFEFPGKATNWTPTIHSVDLAEVYLKVAQRAKSLKGELFNISGANENLGCIFEAIARVTGYKGEIVYKTPSNPWEECFSGNNLKIDSSKAKQLLDWQPQQPTFVEGVERLYAAYKANK